MKSPNKDFLDEQCTFKHCIIDELIFWGMSWGITIDPYFCKYSSLLEAFLITPSLAIILCSISKLYLVSSCLEALPVA